MTEKEIWLNGRWGVIKSAIRELIPDATLHVDYQTDEIIIRTGATATWGEASPPPTHLRHKSFTWPLFLEEVPRNRATTVELSDEME